jgi:hypothetical protein
MRHSRDPTLARLAGYLGARPAARATLTAGEFEAPVIPSVGIA